MALESRTRTRLATGGILLLVFTVGVIIGFALDRWTGGVVLATEASEEQRAEENRTRGRIIDQVDLSSSQKSAVDSILDHHRKDMAELQEYYHPRYWGIVDSTRAAIKEMLTEEQSIKYDSLLAINDELRRESRPPRPTRRE